MYDPKRPDFYKRGADRALIQGTGPYIPNQRTLAAHPVDMFGWMDQIHDNMSMTQKAVLYCEQIAAQSAGTAGQPQF